VTLSLILSVSITTIERAFSIIINIVKNHLRNGMTYQWMNDCLIMYIENDIFKTINNKEIMQQLQNMKTPRRQLNKVARYMTKKMSMLRIYVSNNN
jgi:hypothetical protein